MAAQRSHSEKDSSHEPHRSLDELATLQGLSGKPRPDYLAILRQMWPTAASRDRTIRTLEEMDEAEARLGAQQSANAN